MRTDARVRYTKMVIKDSFIELLKKKPLSKITVKEICELSEINRATFYKHFCDAYDLLDKLEQQFLDELEETIQQSMQTGFYDTITLILVSIKANAEMYQTLFSENGDPHFPGKIFSSCYKHISLDKNKHFLKLSPSKQTWLYYYIAQGCSGILHQWIENKMTEPIEEVAAFADKLIQNTVQSFD